MMKTSTIGIGMSVNFSAVLLRSRFPTKDHPVESLSPTVSTLSAPRSTSRAEDPSSASSSWHLST